MINHHVHGLNQNKTAAVCTFLYLIGMQSWYRPQCHTSGPNNVLYASIILNCFLFYCIVRCFVQWLQDKYMQQMSEELIVPYSIQERCIDEEKGTGTHIRAVTPILPLSLGNIATYVSYNRPKNLNMAVAVSCGWFILMTTIFIIISAVGSLGKNGFIFSPYFFAGVIAASLTEIWFFIQWKPYCTYNSSAEIVPTGEVPSLNSASNCDLVRSNIWRFSPDMLAILCGFLMSTLGGLENFKGKYYLQWLVVPYVLLAFMIISLLQDTEASNNLSRKFLESSVMNFLGYISYTMYLFQAVILTWYAPTISRSYSSRTNVFIQSGNLGDPDWFLRLNPWWRILAILILSVFCWLVQKYYQDTFVMWLYTNLSALYRLVVQS